MDFYHVQERINGCEAASESEIYLDARVGLVKTDMNEALCPVLQRMPDWMATLNPQLYPDSIKKIQPEQTDSGVLTRVTSSALQDWTSLCSNMNLINESHPAQLFILQSQDSCALGKQFHFDHR